jgi:hypothetical protein
MLGIDQAVREEKPADSVSSNYQSPPNIAQYDTGLTIGGLSLDALRNSVIMKESGARFDQYNPDASDGTPLGGAIGIGQVMGANVAKWSREALGYTISKRQFFNNPSYQMQIINHRFEMMMQQQVAAGYSGQELARRVAATWYSGDASLWNGTAAQYAGGQRYPSIGEYTLDIWNRYQGN